MTETTSPTAKVYTAFISVSNNVITVTPTLAAQIGLWKMSLKQDNTKGTATVTYLALNLSINCRVTSLPSLVLTDAQKTYALGSAAKTLDFTDSTINPMTQTPLCNYTWTTNTYSWTGLPSWITTSTSTSGHANAVLNFA